MKGYASGRQDAELESQKSLAQLQSRFDAERRLEAERQTEALRIAAERYQAQVAAAHQADRDFQTQKDTLEKQNAQLQQRIHEVTRNWMDEKGRRHPVKCVFTAGFVQQYNAAFGIAGDSPVSAAADTRRTDNATGTLQGIDPRLRNSDVSQADILANIIDNAGQCRIWRAQLNGLLDYTDGLQTSTGEP
nr:hypothetical protein [Morganella morganii]